mmetsp:Transcript_9559/g.26408  ORF Transcript_9559/g.26408 Transcript_9559/m.26408 type:complete len:276 (+) Transcript_9559:221-1048(+)
MTCSNKHEGKRRNMLPRRHDCNRSSSNNNNRCFRGPSSSRHHEGHRHRHRMDRLLHPLPSIKSLLLPRHRTVHSQSWAECFHDWRSLSPFQKRMNPCMTNGASSGNRSHNANRDNNQPPFLGRQECHLHRHLGREPFQDRKRTNRNKDQKECSLDPLPNHNDRTNHHRRRHHHPSMGFRDPRRHQSMGSLGQKCQTTTAIVHNNLQTPSFPTTSTGFKITLINMIRRRHFRARSPCCKILRTATTKQLKLVTDGTRTRKTCCYWTTMKPMRMIHR